MVFHSGKSSFYPDRWEKPSKKKTLALAWIYLKMFGQMTESLCKEVFWEFKKEDFKNALACFIFEDSEEDEDNDEDKQTNLLVKNIKMRFNKFLQPEYKGTITEWAKEMYFKVSLKLLFLIITSSLIYLFAVWQIISEGIPHKSSRQQIRLVFDYF